MVFQKIDIHPLNIEKERQNFSKVAPNEKERKSVLDWIRNKSIEKQLTERRQVRLMNDFRMYYRINGIPLNQITKDKLLELKENLLNNKIQKPNGETYSSSVISGMTETLTRYLEDTFPNKQSSYSFNNKPLRKWFIVKAKKKTPEILTEQEIKKLYKEAKPLWQKYTIAVLFSSGARIEEFLNFRFEDFEEPSKNFPYWQVDIKEEYSKTLGRKVGLYWEYCTESITKYFDSIEKKSGKDRVVNFDYGAVRMFLNRLGNKVLNKRVHAHMFRKSSATFYASKLNRQQLCKKFGWRFNTNMADVYINRAGVDEFEVKDTILNDDISILRKDNLELKTKLDLLEKEYTEKMKYVYEQIEKKVS